MEEIAQHTNERALRIKKKRGFVTAYRREEDGVSLENWKVVASKGQEGKETTCQSFLLLWALKAFFQHSFDLLPKVRSQWPSLCLEELLLITSALSHCSSASLQLVLEDPDFCCTHGNMFILDNLSNYLSTKCQHFTFYYWRRNNVSQVLFTFLLKLFFCELVFLAQIGLKLTDILLPQIPKCWDYGHNPPCPFFTFHFLPKNRDFFPLRGFCFH